MWRFLVFFCHFSIWYLSFVDLFCFVFVCHTVLSVPCRLGQGWLLDAFLCFCHFPIWCLGSGVVLDCIDSWALPSSLLCTMQKKIRFSHAEAQLFSIRAVFTWFCLKIFLGHDVFIYCLLICVGIIPNPLIQSWSILIAYCFSTKHPKSNFILHYILRIACEKHESTNKKATLT